MESTGVKRDCHMERLTDEQVISIYTGVAKEHFPAEELKPVTMIERLLSEGAYEGLGLFCGETLAAYALFAGMPEGGTLLLDYYAVLAEYRNSGMGSLFLRKMKEFYGGREAILLETEMPEAAKSEAERELRVRRNGFYERNGALFTKVRSRVYKVDFDIFIIPLANALPDEEVYKRLSEIYLYMLGEENYGRHVQMDYVV